jgi:transglutaminase-like putative cysteine protease
MIFEVSHRTTYSYRRPVLQSQHLLHLTPRDSQRQTVLRHSILIEPAPATQSEVRDRYGNAVGLLSVVDSHSELIVHARSTVDVRPPDLPMLGLSTPWELIKSRALVGDDQLDLSVLEFVSASRHTRPFRDALDYAKPSFSAGRPILEAAFELTQRIYRDFKFDSGATDISTPVSHVMRQRRGVCQDFAHVALTCLRTLKLPARYVSGYLLTYPPPGQPKLQGADASHAWFSVWTPEVGWVDFDPTNGVIPTTEHITVAYGRDYDDVSPISGVLFGGLDQRMAVAVDVNAVG